MLLRELPNELLREPPNELLLRVLPKELLLRELPKELLLRELPNEPPRERPTVLFSRLPLNEPLLRLLLNDWLSRTPLCS